MTETTRSQKIVRVFNCDNLYDLRIIENFLVESNLPFTPIIHRHVFHLQEMRSFREDILRMDMDYAVFVVHANESRLSINEKGAGIGYASIYTALQERTGDKVLIVVGGDDHYEGEEKSAVLSDWVRYKISSQFSPKYMDGRKSFIFSWKNKPNPIHYQAVEHFFLKQNEIFEPSESTSEEQGSATEFQIPCPIRGPPPPSGHYLIIRKNIVYRSVSEFSSEQLLREIISRFSDDAVILVSVVEGRISYRECSTDAKHPSSWFYNICPSWINSEPSGTLKTNALLLSGELVHPDNPWPVPEEIEKQLRRWYSSVPLAVVQIYCDFNAGYSYKIYYPPKTPNCMQVIRKFRWYILGSLMVGALMMFYYYGTQRVTISPTVVNASNTAATLKPS